MRNKEATFYWQLKKFKTRQEMEAFIAKYSNIQWREVFVNNAYAIEFRELRQIG